MKTRIATWVYIVGLATIMLYSEGRSVFAACPSHVFPEGNGYSWRYPLNVIVIDNTQTFGESINNSQSDYHSNTDLALADGPTTHFLGNYHNLNSVEGNYGAVGWFGLAMAVSNMTACASFPDGTPTGLCGTTEETSADYAIAYFNSFESERIDNLCRHEDPFDCRTLREKLVRHEWGHIFGMAHNECDSPSVMIPTAYWVVGICDDYNDSLTTSDIDTINCWY